MNEIVKYENQLNSVPLRDFNSVDLDFLMLLCHKCRNKGNEIIEMDFAEIKNMSNYKFHGNLRLIKDLERMNEKLLNCKFKLVTKDEIVQFVLFSTFRINLHDEVLRVRVNEDFSFLLNALDKNFTRFELEQFVNFDSSYSKECYRQLKQYRTTGWRYFEIDEFRRLLNIPTSYKMGNIDQKVLKPIKEDLSNVYQNLKITKQYKRGRGRGGQVVTGIRFDFDKETTDHVDPERKTEPKLSGFNCPNCGKQLYEKVINGSNCWCHLDYKKGGCNSIFNSIADIKCLDETPTRKKEEYDITEMPEELRKKLEEFKM